MKKLHITALFVVLVLLVVISALRFVLKNLRFILTCDANRHQNVITWFLGHALPLQEISSKSVRNFFSVIRRADKQTDKQTEVKHLLRSSSAEVMNLFGVLNSITDVRGRSNEFRTFRHAARRAVYYSICLVRERHTGLAASRIAVRVSP